MNADAELDERLAMAMDAELVLELVMELVMVMVMVMVESPSPRAGSPNGVSPHFLNHWRR